MMCANLLEDAQTRANSGSVQFEQDTGTVRQYSVTAAIHSEYKFTIQPQAEARITVDPNIRGGVPCVGSGNWPITFILEALSHGKSSEQIKQDYVGLTSADIQLALKAAAWVMRDPAIEWQELKLQGMVEFQEELRGWQVLS